MSFRPLYIWPIIPSLRPSRAGRDVRLSIWRRDYDFEVVEAHHRYKVDAPSRTASTIGETIAAALGRNLTDCAVYGRQGVTRERDPSTIGFFAIRGGDVIGEHTALFIGDGERIEITHKTVNRSSYVSGALRAARVLMQQKSGLFDMRDVLQKS